MQLFKISLLLQSRKFWWYLLLTVLFDGDSRRHTDVIKCLQCILIYSTWHYGV